MDNTKSSLLPGFVTEGFATAESIFEQFPKPPFQVRVDCVNGFSVKLNVRSSTVMSLQALERTAKGTFQEIYKIPYASVNSINSALFHMQSRRDSSPHAKKQLRAEKGNASILYAPWKPLSACDQVDFAQEAKGTSPFLSVRERLALGLRSHALAKFVAMGSSIEGNGKMQVIDFPNFFVRVIQPNADTAEYTVLCDVKDDQGELETTRTLSGVNETEVTAYLFDKYKENAQYIFKPTPLKWYSVLPVVPFEVMMETLTAHPAYAPTLPLLRRVGVVEELAAKI